ncbi:gephyrin-like molybdotransferase Glp [Microbulbifer halophilus]|uniref:Molybdopterin molybdenumtransferase n=1 Tax=Microbulbifer halophilus TaxID=453963 RepID=A0ABW5EEE3_9GAMM|nr:gephyrin-like molybdotransferase Glp [Microbulbifer halophilus]MCW8125805.1 molybdopterin molybdotransferase MoeA [Microbulbifer halophilus]
MTIDPRLQSGLLPVEQARAQLLESVTPLRQTETLPLEQACGRVLAEPADAQVDLPPCDNSAMDGYALCGEGRQFTLVGKSLAGHPHSGNLQPGQCVRITTGAALPGGADRVVMQENADLDGETVLLQKEARIGEHIRRRGEDVGSGEQIVPAGRRLKVADIALLAAAGVSRVTVLRRLRAALLSVGDELKPLETPAAELGTGDIYDSNRIALKAALGELDIEVVDLGCQPDDPGQIRAAFEKARDSADIVITSGGVSVGEADYTRDVLEELGQLEMWRLAIKPGKPFTFGRLPRTEGVSYFFGLPGNPVSALVTLYQLVLPALEKLRGAGDDVVRFRGRARLLNPIRKSPGRLDFQRGYTYRDGDGLQVVETAGIQGSHILSGFSRANCFIVLPRESGNCDTGDWVTIEPFQKPLT